MTARRTFRLDRENGKLLGVCAGLAESTGLDVTLIRVALVVLTLAGGFPWTLIAYGAAAWAAGDGDRTRRLAAPRRHNSVADIRAGMRDIDRRMAEIEDYVTSNNKRLAREIDELR